MSYEQAGYEVFSQASRVRNWALCAYQQARVIATDPDMQAAWLRHGRTWFVGVDALPNDARGMIGQHPLTGPWERLIGADHTWHRAQLSVVYPNYPIQDIGESDAAHRFRTLRCAAHVDGLLPQGTQRFLREPHAFVLAIALNDCSACPLVVWPGSHKIMGAALREVIGTAPPSQVDVTSRYKAARAQVFDQIEPVRLEGRLGGSMLLHRHLLHGVAPWRAGDVMPPEGRMVAYFRPQFIEMRDWLG